MRSLSPGLRHRLRFTNDRLRTGREETKMAQLWKCVMSRGMLAASRTFLEKPKRAPWSLSPRLSGCSHACQNTSYMHWTCAPLQCLRQSLTVQSLACQDLGNPGALRKLPKMHAILAQPAELVLAHGLPVNGFE